MYKNETDSVFKTTDYIEVDTGSQGSEIIKEKLINYIHFFEEGTHLFPLPHSHFYTTLPGYVQAFRQKNFDR